MNGAVVILSGPSGVGKDSVLDKWKSINPMVGVVVTCTTRPMRSNEVEGEHYHFLQREEFEEMAANGEFLEWKLVHGNLYGSPIASVDDLAKEGRVAVLKIDVKGAMDVMERRPDVLSIFILPPSIDELHRRIRARGANSEDEIVQRLADADYELRLSDRYQFRVVNDRMDECADRIDQWVKKQIRS